MAKIARKRMDDWPGDPAEDAKMTAGSLADLGRKHLPIRWGRIENALRADDGLGQEFTAEGSAVVTAGETGPSLHRGTQRFRSRGRQPPPLTTPRGPVPGNVFDLEGWPYGSY